MPTKYKYKVYVVGPGLGIDCNTIKHEPRIGDTIFPGILISDTPYASDVERFYEIDDADYDDIVAQIQEAFNIGAIAEGDSTLEVALICPDTEDTITFTVKISDYAKFNDEE